jgi:hypothetical protein
MARLAFFAIFRGFENRWVDDVGLVDDDSGAALPKGTFWSHVPSPENTPLFKSEDMWSE